MKNIIATTIIVAIIDKTWLPVKRTVLSVGDKPEYSQHQAHARTKFSNIDPGLSGARRYITIYKEKGCDDPECQAACFVLLPARSNASTIIFPWVVADALSNSHQGSFIADAAARCSSVSAYPFKIVIRTFATCTVSVAFTRMRSACCDTS